jgi:hypothetical protein
MTLSHIKALAEEALALSERASKPPWNHMDSQDEVWDADGRTLIDFSQPATAADKHFIAHSRTSVPVLARAVLEMLPFVQHDALCSTQYEDVEGSSKVCSCGLGAALAKMGEAYGI